jgi:hypothetical protein
MAFMTKAENDTPLESKISGGARTNEGQKFYQKKLQGVAEWVRNQQLMKEGLPPNPPNPEDLQLPYRESLLLEFRRIIDLTNNEIETADFARKSAPIGLMGESKELLRVVLRLLYAGSEAGEAYNSDAVEMLRAIEVAIEQPFAEIIDPSLRGNERANIGESELAADVFNANFAPVIKILKAYIKSKNSITDPKANDLAIRSAVKNAYGKRSASILSVAREFEEAEAMPAEEEEEEEEDNSGENLLSVEEIKQRLRALTMKQLREQAREQGMVGYVRLNKDDLITALLNNAGLI